MEPATCFSEGEELRAARDVGGSSGPVARMNAASCKVECSGSALTGDRGTNFEGTAGGLEVDFVCLITGVEGTLRTPAGLGVLVS